MSNCFEPAIYLKRVKPFYLGTFYSIVKFGSFQPAALISRAAFFLHLSNGWNASFHMPLLFFTGLSSEQQRRKKSGSVQLPSDSFLSLMDLASATSPFGLLKGSSILLRSYWEPSFGCLFISLPDCIFSIA